MIENFNDTTLAQPSWDKVRPIYKKLSEEFHYLTDPYNVTINPDVKNHLDHLIISIDEVDNYIDELEDVNLRNSITKSLIEYLNNDDFTWKNSDNNESLSETMKTVKYIVTTRSIRDEFVNALKIIFHNTEVKRHTKSIDELMNYILLEGEATAILPLSILGIKSDEKFGQFFSKLCKMMGIADLLFDARKDYKNGIISIKPNLKLYIRILRILMVDGVKIILSFPKKISFLLYCMRFIRELNRE